MNADDSSPNFATLLRPVFLPLIDGFQGAAFGLPWQEEALPLFEDGVLGRK